MAPGCQPPCLLLTCAGVRAAPGAEELRTFVEALAPLDGLRVGRLLAAKMVRWLGRPADNSTANEACYYIRDRKAVFKWSNGAQERSDGTVWLHTDRQQQMWWRSDGSGL